MSKAVIVLLCLLFCFTTQQTLKPLLLLPTETTQNVTVDYAFKFSTDTNVPQSASISLIFPFEYDPRQLIRYKGCFFSYGTAALEQKPCSVSNRTFRITVDDIVSGELTIFIKNIRNPLYSSMSSHFSVKTMFRDVTIAENMQFGKLPFTMSSIISSSTGTVYNYENDLIEQGSTWVFKFVLAQTYPVNSTVRFVFPEGFTSNKVICNITGIIDSTMQTRVFPQLNIYDCLNVKAALTGTQNIILSGIVNPKFQMQMTGLQVQIIQPNNLVILKKISITNQPMINAKNMNVSLTMPNKFRNNSCTYIFEINMDSTLDAGDYVEMTFNGNWTFFLNNSKFIEGIESSYYNKARFQATYRWPTNSKISIRNFSQISKSSQVALYLSLRTPLTNNFYPFSLIAYKANGKVVERYTTTIQINQTTGYIRQMRLHPMNQAVKLPVGQTGPVQITLALRNNLPKTNVLTYGKVVIQITPQIPYPNINVNGVHKCYFYGDIPAKNCTYDVSNPLVTNIVAFTPVDFNFQSSQIPFMVTTQGFKTQDDEGLTIDTLVKRYHFKILFYTDYSPSVPTQVIFTDWVANPILLIDFTCSQITQQGTQWSHLKCQFTTPNQILNDGYLHILRIEFVGSGWATALGYSSQTIYPDFPCLVYGTNVNSVPYPRCDLYTHTANGPYRSQASVPYMNIYGIEIIPANSVIKFQLPKVMKANWWYTAQLSLKILEDTYGYQTDYIKLYSQTITVVSSIYIYDTSIVYTPSSVTYTMTNSVVNKVGDITLTSLDLIVAGAEYIIFQVEQSNFPDIGRDKLFTCGAHKCSKFNKPIQYFILYPSTTLTRYQNLVFPGILNPSKAGQYTFNIRVYKSYTVQRKISFPITITPDTLAAPVYTFASYETITQMFPNTRHYYKVSWTLKNALAAQTSYIEVIFTNSVFTLASKYCQLTTSVQAWDGKQIQCEVWEGSTKVIINNMQEAIVGATFTLVVEMTTSLSSGTVTPMVSIYTYVSGGFIVDQIVNSPFTPAAIVNTNLQTLNTFDFSKSHEFVQPIRKGYFGDLIVNYDAGYASTSLVETMVLTFTPQFYPYSNALLLPLSCKINLVRYPCSYTLNPFEVTITMLAGIISTGNNVINITTEYLQRNGIQFPANQGRYLFKSQLKNNVSAIVQRAEQFIDIKPAKIQYFNVSYAHRDAGLDNIYIAQFQNGPNVITAYNDASNASRIYIGFPLVNGDGSGTVFTTNLGFSNGSVVPCYFETGTDYVLPISGKVLQCRLRRSPYSPIPTYVQIINFGAIAAGKKIRVFMAKIRNPTTKIIDMNFNLKINYFNPANFQETPQYENDFNMWIDMLDASVSTNNAADTTSTMFQAGAKVGDLNKFVNHIPYTITSPAFSQNDWFIVVMNSQFQINGVINNCIFSFYKRCIPFKQINWVAIHINNGTLIPFFLQIAQLPLSISRTDTYYQCFTWKAERWSETITYTINAANRWIELRGAITNFSFKVLGSQNKLNIGQKNVDVLVGFTVQHKVPARGTIQIKFPNNSTRVPLIKPHCRSAVTLGSTLYGQNTGKPAINKQGQIGCLVQNSFSWLITSYQQLPANSQVMISGVIDFPTVTTTTLGTGFVVTYSNEHSSDVFTNGRIVDYLSTNFPLQVENKTWSLVEQVTLMRAQPLRINHAGKFDFKIQIQDFIRDINSFYAGYIDVNFWRTTILGQSGGFSAPSTANLVCSITHQLTGQKFACVVSSVTTYTSSIGYRLKFYYEVAVNTPYIISITTQKGDSSQGIPYPSVVGTYKIETQVMYYINYNNPLPTQCSKAHYIDVYGPQFNALNLVSTVSIPGQSNLLLVEIVPSTTITNNLNRIVIEIPTVSNDGVNLFEEDLGMGYRNYDDLLFDLYDSSITSMKCKFYIGDRVNLQPVRIICNQYSLTSITTAHVIRFGFWVRNPNLTASIGIPVQIYVDQTNNHRKLQWQLLQSGIKIIPTKVSPINDFGNFFSDTPSRQVKDTDFRFTNRNTKSLQAGDYYILKFNFDLRNSDKKTSAFKYPYAAYANSGNAIFLRNCRTILLQVGATPLANYIADATQSNKLNVLLDNVMYNPSVRLTSSEAEINAYAVYMATEQCEQIIHKDAFPALVPNEPTVPDFQVAFVNGNDQKGQYEDYKFSFRINDDILTDTALVKRISIQFPPFATYDFKFRGQSCIQDPSSTMEIKSCKIDTSTGTIWIQPFQKSTYQNNNYLVIQTLGKAIINPLSKMAALDRVLLNQFTIKYYTWANDDNPPAIFATSDDFCFMRQDSTRLSGSVFLSYNTSSITVGHHDYAEISQETYVNQFLPLSTDIGTATTRAKTPLEFKFIAMTAFASRENTNFYHTIAVKYNSFYSVTSYSRTNDLQRYIPVCQLNGFRIHSCVIDANLITMSFQQPIAASEQVSVKLSVNNPVDNTDDGFILINLNSPMITLPVYITPYGGTSYLLEAQPFPTFYRSAGASVPYPSMGIYSATVAIGTPIVGKFNYLDFVLTFSRGDINGLVLEIPLLQLDGGNVYSDSKLLGLQSGAEYPCSVGHDLNVFCYYQRGQTKTYGKPTRIYISRFTVQTGNTLSFRMLYTNPDVMGVMPSFVFKAFGGTINADQFMGDDYMGEFRINNAFKTVPPTSYYSTSSACYPQPNRRLFSEATSVLFYIDKDVTVGGYVILEWTLHDPTYKQVSTHVINNNTYDYDYFIINTLKDSRKIYIVKKITAFWDGWSDGNGVQSYHTYGYFRNKHFLVNDAKIYYFQTPYMTLYTCTVDQSWHNTYRDVNQYTFDISYYDIQDKINGGWGWQFVSIDMGTTNPSTLFLNSADIGEMVVVAKMTNNLAFSALSSNTNDCNLQDGLRNTNLLRPITCTMVLANNQIIFRNVNKFTGRYLKFYFYARTSANTYYHRVQLRAYANEDAYTANRWQLFTDQTPNFVLEPLYLANDAGYDRNESQGATAYASQQYSSSPIYLINDQYDGGWVKINSVSSTAISITARKGTTSSYSPNVYRMSFRFYIERLSFSGACTVTAGPATPNGIGSRTCSLSGHVITLNYSYYSSSNSHNWPTWSANQDYTFGFTIGSVTGQLNANFLFVTMAYSYFTSVYYNNAAQCGGCVCSALNCQQSSTVDGQASQYCSSYDCSYYDYWGDYISRSCCNWPYYSTRTCEYYSCRWYWKYGGQYISGKAAVAPFSSILDVVQSYSADLISEQRSVQTQLMIHFSNLKKNVGPTYQSYLLVQLNGQAFTSNNPFRYTSDSQIAARIECKCLRASYTGISISSGTTYLEPLCVRYKPVDLQASIGISIDVSVGQDLRCFFPGFTTTSSTYMNIDIFIEEHNYHHTDMPRPYWAKYSQHDQVNLWLNVNSLQNGLGFDDWYHNIGENNYWAGSETTNSRYYDLNISCSYNTYQPELYMSMYAPQPSTDFCTTNSWSYCRIYTSFVNRRFYFVAKSTSSGTSSFRITGTTNFPPSIDFTSTNYPTLLYWTQPSWGSYRSSFSDSRSGMASVIAPSTATKSIKFSPFGSFLQNYNTSLALSVYLDAKKVYAFDTTFGSYRGSFIKVTFSGLTNLKGCSATLRNQPRGTAHGFICQVRSISQINIYSRRDATITDFIYFTIYTAGLPASSTYTVELFDRYVSASDYARSFSVSASWTRSRGGYTTVDSSQIQWRRPAYKEYRPTTGPIRFTMNNNYEYVSDYDEATFLQTTSTDAIVVYIPSGISSGDRYMCYAREYREGKKTLYRSFQVPCAYWSANKVFIKPLRMYTFKPIYFYEFVIYRTLKNQTMYITLPTADVYSMQIITTSQTSSQLKTHYDYFDYYKYQPAYTTVLNSIYTLTKEAAANNSLFIEFRVNVIGSSFNIMEFEIPNLGLSSFKIDNGEEIPCYLSTQFTKISAKVQLPRCYGYTNGIDTDYPLIIRVFGMAAWSSGTTFKLAFDNFNNPSVQKLFLSPIDIMFRYIDRTNRRSYDSYWPSVYLTDSITMGSPTQISGSLSRTSNNRGVGNTHYTSVSWPYNSASGDSQKMVLKLAGGLTCCSAFTGINLRDNGQGYTQLWRDTKANMSVYRTPSYGVGTSRNLQITGVNNPYPYQRDTYEKLKKIQILFYSGYKAVYSKKLDQFNFNTYSMVNQFSIDSAPTSIDSPRSYLAHQDYPLTYRFTFGTSRNQFNLRQLSYTIITFTTGVTSIEWAHAGCDYSPLYYNSLLQVTIGKNAANKYFLNVSGMSDSSYYNIGKWYLEMRFFTSSSTINYLSETYALNGELEFTNSQVVTISSSFYQTVPYAPSVFSFRQEKYFNGYYQLQRRPIFAKAASSASKLEFRFKTPYSITNQQTIDLLISDNTELLPSNTPTTIYCMIRKTITTNFKTGISYWAPCTYTSGRYRINNPIGDLLINTEYTLTIIERNQTTSAFKLPFVPKRIEVSSIYTSALNLMYGDVYELDFEGRMTNFQVAHASWDIGSDNMIGITFTPGFTLLAASSTSPLTQTMLQLQIYSKEYQQCINARNVFATDGAYFASGTYFSHFSNPATASQLNANTRLKCGQYSVSFTPIKLTTTDYGQITAGTSYYFRYPLIRNPTADDFIPFLYKFKLLEYKTDLHYANVISSYEYQGLESTRDGNSYGETGNLLASNANVQTSVTLSYSWPNFNQGSGSQTWIKWKNNLMQAFTDISTLKTISTSNYFYEYYPNINLCVYRKSNSADDRTVDLGVFPTTDDVRNYQLSWIHLIYPDKVNRQIQTNLNNAIAQITTWSTSSFALVSGVTSTYAENIFRVTFSSSILRFVEGTYMKVIFTNSNFVIMDEYCKSTSGFVQGTTNFSSNFVCKRHSSTQILIQGYQTISTSTVLSFDIYLKVNTNSIYSQNNARAYIQVFSKDDKNIISAYTSYLSSYTTMQGAVTMKLQNAMRYKFMKDTARELYLQFRLTSNALNVNQYFEIDFGAWKVDTSAIGQIICKYKLTGNYYWIPAVLTFISGNKYRFTVYKNFTTYSIPANNLVTLRIDHINPDNFYGLLVPDTKWNYLKITAHQAAGTVLEHQYAQIWVEPFEHLSLNVIPALDYVDATSIYDFTVTPNVTVAAGDYILLQFTVADGLYFNLFPDNLGKNILTNDSLEISCRQTNNAMIISNSNIKCELFKGDTTASPSIPVTIQIKVQKSIAANQLISFNILSLKNPNLALYPIGITFKLANICIQSDSNRLCPFYKSTQYLYFKTAPAIAAVISNTGSMAFNPNIVSAINSKHTISASYALAIGDYVKIVYYNQVIVKDTCSLQVANGICYAYPLENSIIIKVTVAQTSPYTFILNGMTNLYQFSGSQLYTQLWKFSTKTITSRFYTSYSVPIITTDPVTSNPLAITFTPTLTPNYQLSYNFDNIAKIQISYLLQNKNIQQIFLTSPSNIVLNLAYCNATLETDALQKKPYPFRYRCQIISSSQVRITQQSDFPAWRPDFINKKVIVYLKYTINQALIGLQSNNWVATTYTDPSSTSSNLRVSQATGKFSTQVYMSPFIYKVDFFTFSFTKRICLTGEKCMFYGYLLPSTPYNSPLIKYMDYTIPAEFQYTNLVSYNACDLRQKNSDAFSFGCTATRNNSKITVRFMPTTGGYTYNHDYKLMKIDNSDGSKLFTAPQYPGTHYQMKVDLYTTANLLIQSQYINLTTVYGNLLSYNDIAIAIPQDAQTIGLFQITFKVGATAIQPAYQSSATNLITSAIQIVFSNSFQFDLGTGKKAGEQVACLPVLNLNLKTMGKLTCRIYPSYSTITNPTIIVTGYDKILSGLVVTFTIAGLKSLPLAVQDYIKVGVSYKYYQYGNVKGYLYEPTGKVVGPITAKAAAKTITVAITQTSSNFVGELVNYTFTCTLPGTFTQVKTTDYIGIQFPLYGFEGRFSMNQKVKCSLASGSACSSFGLANVIYFKPAAAVTTTSLSFNLNDMINTAFSYDYTALNIKVFTVINGKVDSQGTGSVVKLSKPSVNISGLITKTDSNYGGESGISYYFDFKLGTYLPQYGKISIKFPKVYSSLFELYSKCNFTSETLNKLGDQAYCQIVSSNQLIITPNGLLMDSTFTYGIIVSNLTNPNLNITSQKFIIESYYSPDIYTKQIISSNTFSPPQINVLTIKACQFDLVIQTRNQNYKSFYQIALICPSVIKQASLVKIYLPWSLSSSVSKQLCTSTTSSLYSYECSIKNEYVNNKLVSFMEFYLRQHVPQKLISIKGEITNGIKGAYTLNASISYKAFTYLIATSSKISIQDTSVKQLSNIEIQVQNYPYNRNYESLYTFKITNPKILANSIRIEVPSTIRQGVNGITCNSQLSSTKKDYFAFLALLNATSLVCTMSGQNVLINGISGIISALKDDQFLFFDVFGLNNPDISVNGQSFKFTFLNITDSSGSAIGTITRNIAYTISQAPYNLQINSIDLTSKKFEVMTTYTLVSSSIANSIVNITSQSSIGVKVEFPEEYSEIWSITAQPPQVRIYLGSSLYTTTNINMIDRKLMAKFTVNAYESFSQVKVMFDFRNPAKPINCTTSKFSISIYDFKLNSIIAQTVGNNAACLQLSDKLFWIKVSGNSEIRAGNLSTYSIEIQKPAKYLKITPQASTSAISFSPSEIIFKDYSSTIEKFNITSSPAFSGSFTVAFTKTQPGSDIFYNDIKNETVKIMTPINPFLINFEQISSKSIGQPIETFISIQVPSTIAFALLHTNNCSSSYEILPQGRISIPAGSKQVSFSIKYKGSVIPYMCAIKFEISSLTNINYALTTNTLYLAGEPSIDRTNSLRPMILKLTKQPKDSKDVGASILTSDKKSTLKPIIYSLKDKILKANWIQLEVSLSQPGFIYYAAMEVGTEQQKVTQNMIFDHSIKTGIVYNKTRAVISSVGSVNILSDLILTGLESDKRYLIGAYLNSTVGISQIMFKQVQTTKSSNGAVLKICFNSISTNQTILTTISTILRFKSDRLSIFTVAQVLTDIQTAYQTSVMNSRRYIYEVVLAPNRFDDSISPIQSFNDLISSKDLQNKVKALIPSFDLTYTMTANQIILAKPRARGNGITIEQLTYHNVRVRVQFWEVAYVYGVIVPMQKGKSSLLTKQIIQGLNRQNLLLNATHRIKAQTNSQGIAYLEFRLLKQLQDYEIFITAQCVLPYQPRAQLSDSEVLKSSIKTSTNLNTANNGQKIIQKLKQIKNDDLAQAVKEHLLNVELKKNLNDKVTKIRKRKL